MKSDILKGPGGAPIRASILPETAADRKRFPVASGVLDYFPDALVAIAEVSKAGNDQHNPGKPLQWDRSKSGDEADTMQRHFLQRGSRDTDGLRHTAKMAWRALALLQKEIEAEQLKVESVDEKWDYYRSLRGEVIIWRGLRADKSDLGRSWDPKHNAWSHSYLGPPIADFEAAVRITRQEAANLGADVTAP